MGDNNTHVKVLIGSFLIYRVHSLYQSLSWESATKSTAYHELRKVVNYLVVWMAANPDTALRLTGGEGNFISAMVSAAYYRPLSENGIDRMPIPSTSPQPFVSIDPTVEIKVLSPWKLGGLTLKNRVIRAAAFDGSNVKEITKTHEDVAKGGVGMTVVAYCCVSEDGRTFEDQVSFKDKKKSREVLSPVVEACHRQGTAICAQLTHGGSVSSAHLNKAKVNIAPSPVFSPANFDFPKGCDDKDMDRLVEDFVEGALFAIHELKFDAIEMHYGHGYFLSQWLSPLLNVRTDIHGGTPQNRVRFPLRVLKSVREALPKDVPILVKLNSQDGVAGGLELTDALTYAEILADYCDLIVVSCGLVIHNGFYLLRGVSPLESLIQGLPGIKKWGAFLFGPLAVPTIKYDDCFNRDSARAVLKRVNKKTQVCLLGGVSSLTQMEGAIQEGFAAVQMARPLIREPDFLHRIRKEIQEYKNQNMVEENSTFDVETKCIRCNQCVLASVDPKQEMGCPFRKLEESNVQKTLSISPAMARTILPDIEDIRGPRM